MIDRWNIDSVSEECRHIGLRNGLFPKMHQLEGLCFMLNRQDHGSGYILAHDMGLGKTLQALLLISISNRTIERGTTLVLCPPQCSDIWIKEAIKLFEKPPSMLLYKGNSEWISYKIGTGRKIIIKRIKDSDTITYNVIKDHDIVISHYQALTSLWKKNVIDVIKKTSEMRQKKRGDDLCPEDFHIPGLAWRVSGRFNSKIIDVNILPEKCQQTLGCMLTCEYNRIIVDEAHNMKNPRTLLATMAYAIYAKHRLCLTGTPKVNYDQDVWSLFHFLRVPGLVSFEEFKEKSDKLLDIRKRGITEKNTLYHRVDSDAKRYIERLYAQYMHVVTKSEVDRSFSTITKDPRSLVEKCVTGPSSTINHGIYERTIMVDMDKHTIEAYETIRLARLSDKHMTCDSDDTSGDESYSIDKKSKKVYAFATINILRQITSDPTICKNHMMEYCDRDLVKKVMRETPSKFKALLDYLNTNVYVDEKVVIFCYFKKACHNIAAYLVKNNLNGIHVITGDNTKDQKNVAVEMLHKNRDCKILISTMCLTEGVNMTDANHCIIFTPWWNDAKDRQTVSRLHRMGQNRDVHMVYFINSSSIEERIRHIAATKGRIPSTKEIMLVLGMSACNRRNEIMIGDMSEFIYTHGSIDVFNDHSNSNRNNMTANASIFETPAAVEQSICENIFPVIEYCGENNLKMYAMMSRMVANFISSSESTISAQKDTNVLKKRTYDAIEAVQNNSDGGLRKKNRILPYFVDNRYSLDYLN